MIEAMACGTPVIAWNCGSVPEVIVGVSRQTVLRWASGEFDPSPEHTAKAKELVRARIGELQRLPRPAATTQQTTTVAAPAGPAVTTTTTTPAR
jgi:hypothetical protein